MGNETKKIDDRVHRRLLRRHDASMSADFQHPPCKCASLSAAVERLDGLVERMRADANIAQKWADELPVVPHGIAPSDPRQLCLVVVDTLRGKADELADALQHLQGPREETRT